jgi:histidyl-tRNA synthetase
MDLTTPRGTQDLLSERADAMVTLYEEAHRVARLFGYRYVETPTFEHTELFARSSGETSDVVTKEMYTFDDKGGRSLTLRPEGTAGVLRAYLEHAQELPSPFKAYYLETFFRHGRPQAGRLREFRQFGIEIIGDPGPGSDVEAIVVGDRFLRSRPLRDLTLRLNSIGDEVCRPAYRRMLIDYFAPHEAELDADCRARLQTNPLRVLDCKVDGHKDFVLAAPVITDHLCEPCAAHFDAVRGGLDAAGIGYTLDPRLVRGLDYYTRTAFEFVAGALSAGQGTVCGGGRYDGLAEVLGGAPTPGIGFGLGLDRVLLTMELEGAPAPAVRGPRCFVVTIGDAARTAGAALLDTLRGADVPATWSLEERPMKAQFKMADRAGAAFVAILGDQELADGTVTLRRLVDGVQKAVPSADVVRWLTRLDDWADRA